MLSDLVRQYCKRHGIASIDLSVVDGLGDGAEGFCHADIRFCEGYGVQFKLPLPDSPLSNGIHGIRDDGELRMELGAGTVDDVELSGFFADIEPHIVKICHEQSVQNITYLGNRFRLNNKTSFDVIADEHGHLTIEMRCGGERRQAVMLASALLDGLYDGTIQHFEARYHYDDSFFCRNVQPNDTGSCDTQSPDQHQPSKDGTCRDLQ